MTPALLAAALLAAASPDEPTPGHPVELPVEVVENRFILTPRDQGGRKVRLYSDTGGGHTILSPELVSALGLWVMHPEAGQDVPAVTGWPSWNPYRSIPAPARKVLVMPLPVQLGPGLDGFLGQDWFAGRSWTFDYRGKRLLLRANGEFPRGIPGAVGIPFNLPEPGSEPPPVEGITFLPKRSPEALAFGRITIGIGGERYDVLFDTGATTELVPEAVAKVGDGRALQRAASFMMAATFDAWRKAHPDWLVVEKAEARTGADMIRVPLISVANQKVGPVWFTRRPNEAFANYMSSMTDKWVVGALGGNALQYFRVTVDYTRHVAYFER